MRLRRKDATRSKNRKEDATGGGKSEGNRAGRRSQLHPLLYSCIFFCTSLMGRRRTTGCTARHFPGEPCSACAAVRTARSRLRQADRTAADAVARVRRKGVVDPPPAIVATSIDDPERAALDAAAAEHRAACAAARAHVAVYRARGLIIPPAACERCGIGERLTPWSRPTPLIPWHPDPTKKTEVSWLCVRCRRHVRATREPLALTWVWPGGLPVRPRGRPPQGGSRHERIVAFEIEPAWRASAEAAAEPARLPGLAAELFLRALLAAAGPENVETLYLIGVLAGSAWAPTGDAVRDAAFRTWAEQERVRRSSAERLAEIVPAWERRPRRDRRPLLLPPLDEGKRDQEPTIVDESAQVARTAAALERLSEAEAQADAALERVRRAMEQFRAPGALEISSLK